MRSHHAVLAMLVAASCLMAPACSDPQPRPLPAATRSVDDADHQRWIAGVVADLTTLKPGATRAEIETVCVRDGGLSSANACSFGHRGCPCAQIDVEFAGVATGAQESPTDVATAISRPYLGYPPCD